MITLLQSCFLGQIHWKRRGYFRKSRSWDGRIQWTDTRISEKKICMSLWCRKITNQPKSSHCQLRVFLKHLEVVCQPLGVGPVSTKEIWTQVCADAGEEHNAQPSVQLLNGLVPFLGQEDYLEALTFTKCLFCVSLVPEWTTLSQDHVLILAGFKNLSF